MCSFEMNDSRKKEIIDLDVFEGKVYVVLFKIFVTDS